MPKFKVLKSGVLLYPPPPCKEPVPVPIGAVFQLPECGETKAWRYFGQIERMPDDAVVTFTPVSN